MAKSIMAAGNVNWDNFLENNLALKEPNVCPLAQLLYFEQSSLQNWGSCPFLWNILSTISCDLHHQRAYVTEAARLK